MNIIWQFNRETREVEIVQDGQVIETTTLAEAPRRVTALRGEAARDSSIVEASPYKRRNRR